MCGITDFSSICYAVYAQKSDIQRAFPGHDGSINTERLIFVCKGLTVTDVCLMLCFSALIINIVQWRVQQCKVQPELICSSRRAEWTRTVSSNLITSVWQCDINIMLFLMWQDEGVSARGGAEADGQWARLKGQWPQVTKHWGERCVHVHVTYWILCPLSPYPFSFSLTLL